MLERDPGSFRDPSGFVYRRDGVVLRQVNRAYLEEWLALEASGLMATLVRTKRLIPHEEVALELAAGPGEAVAVIRPEPLEFVSYPYEWTFSQLKDAALLTLDVQDAAMASGFTLKDASAFNVQFHRGRPLLIDSLSFERATPGAPWVAYRQFCEHFLAPLALMAYRDVRFGALLRDFIDGIPLDFAAELLPTRTWLRLGIAAHIRLHARAQHRYADQAVTADKKAGMSPARLQALVASLRSTVRRLDWQPAGTEWADYTENTNYDEAATNAKAALVERFLAAAAPKRVWDLGANTGRYSRIAADGGAWVLAPDGDPAAAERHYRALEKSVRARIMPLVIDLANPSPDLGWNGLERASFIGRANADVSLALALVHHLAIGRNIPLPDVAQLMARLSSELIIEWVPKEDSQVRRLLASRRDVFADYTEAGFRAAFEARFELVEEAPIPGTVRILMRYRRREPA